MKLSRLVRIIIVVIIDGLLGQPSGFLPHTQLMVGFYF